MQVFVSRFLSDDVGAAAIEYAMTAALIAVVILGAVTALGQGVRITLFNRIAAAMP